MDVLEDLCRDCRSLSSQEEAIPHRRLRLASAVFGAASVRETYVCRACPAAPQRLVPDDASRPTVWLAIA
ncbi:MAG TPA: hypothetical protein VHP37_07750 [Burkholderiales bacterium]|nr:hypothetical protein [Burkholderiales bacterium]